MLKCHQMTPGPAVWVDTPVGKLRELPLETFNRPDGLFIANTYWWRKTCETVLDQQCLNQDNIVFVVRGTLTHRFANACSHS